MTPCLVVCFYKRGYQERGTKTSAKDDNDDDDNNKIYSLEVSLLGGQWGQYAEDLGTHARAS